MRSARMLLAAGAASAALALGAPGAYADGSDHEDSSYSQEQDNGHDKESNGYGEDNGKEDSTGYGEDNGRDNGEENGKEDAEDNGRDNGEDNGKEDAEDNGRDNGEDNGKEHDKDNGGDHDEDDPYDSPRGGMRTGGGALAAVNEGDWGSGQRDSGSHKDGGQSSGYKEGGQSSGYRDGGQGKGSWGGDHDKPRGGMHTGGGALAAPTVTAGGMAALAVAGAGLYVVRRKKSAESAG
ncbi:hypothetical protein AB0L74_25350 [Streptomyces sp. NPDC052020]|uniref:hypothetical protein n=1 Tax=Streptomyces sp. NPDC052020 TaxID=3155677 RepID=UPI00343EB188